MNRLLDLIVNSLYSNRDVFLRELDSNASDALDKLRFAAVSDPSVMSASADMKIKIKGDKENNLLVVEDTGIGMTRDDLVSSLGACTKNARPLPVRPRSRVARRLECLFCVSSPARASSSTTSLRL